jgi:hypothetical protein
MSSPPSAYINSPAFIDAVNDARFVRTFGFLALLGPIFLIFLVKFFGPGVAAGMGIAVMGYGSKRYYRILGFIIIILAAAGLFLPPSIKPAASILGSAILCIGICAKGWNVLKVLGTSDRNAPDWELSRKHILIGFALSSLGLLFVMTWLILYLVGLFLSGHL